MAYAGKNASRVSDSAVSTLPLLAYLALAIGLMVVDHRVGYGTLIRQRFSVITGPLQWLAASPMRALRAGSDEFALRSQLQTQNTRLRHENEIDAARLSRLAAVSEENRRLRELLGGVRGYRLNVQMVGILDIDLDPYRQRLLLDAGSQSGVHVGQALIDAGGVLGQVIEVLPRRSTALLLTDPDHAIPVQVARSGLRTLAYGTGRADRLDLPNIPLSADIRVGDLLVTSGIGGRFPAGFPVGTVTTLNPDSTRLFVVAQAAPSAHLDRGAEVLLVSNLPIDPEVGPPAPQPRPVASAPAPAKPQADTP